eukprot:5630259-Pyramimonas_sp.AAC.1
MCRRQCEASLAVWPCAPRLHQRHRFARTLTRRAAAPAERSDPKLRIMLAPCSHRPRPPAGR